ncbi:MAG: hypothetical protein ACKPKO_30600, partial [Candidatus Fonsibacter sp.]
MLETSADKTLSIKDGTTLKVLQPEEVQKCAVIEITKATDQEEGPEELNPDEDRALWRARASTTWRLFAQALVNHNAQPLSNSYHLRRKHG